MNHILNSQHITKSAKYISFKCPIILRGLLEPHWATVLYYWAFVSITLMMIDICTRAFSVEKSGDSEVYDYRTQKDVYYKSVDCCLKKKA